MVVRLIVGFLLANLLVSFLAPGVFGARNLTITTTDKTSLFGQEEITLTASASGFTDGESIYIKNAFYGDGSTNYFGYTKNGDNWIKNGDSTISQRSVKIGEWDLKIVGKSDFLDSGFNGEGDYKLKLGFYYTTTGGNLSSVNWSENSLDIHINEPDPTPTPTPAITPTPRISPTVTAVVSASIRATPAVPIVRSVTPLPRLVSSPSPISEVLSSSDSAFDIQSLDEELSDPVSPSPSEEKVLGERDQDILKIIILIGTFFILLGGFIFLVPKFLRRFQN